MNYNLINETERTQGENVLIILRQGGRNHKRILIESTRRNRDETTSTRRRSHSIIQSA